MQEIYGGSASISISFEKALVPEVSGKYRIARSLIPIRIEDYLATPNSCEVM